MTFAGFVSYVGVPHAAWYDADRSLFLYQDIGAFRGSGNIDLITRFSNNVTLNTTNNSRAFPGPQPPGTYQQVFPDMPLDELWERHREAERYLTEQCGVVFTPRLPDLDWPEADDINARRVSDSHQELDLLSQSGLELVRQNLLRTHHAQSRYAIRLFQWSLLWSYWFLVRDWFVRKRSVEQLIEKGWCKHPQDLPGDYRKWYQ